MSISLNRRLTLITAAFLTLFTAISLAPSPTRADTAGDTKQLWQALQSGKAFAIMRHALAPGTGDPARFKLNDCSTQRNLSDEGRRQARRIGDLFRTNGIVNAAIFTSQWCRCRETAKLLALGTPTDLPSINSFFQAFENREPQTRAVRAWLADRARGESSAPLVLVAHQVNISALTGRFTRSGEIVFVSLASAAPGKKIQVLGSIIP